MKMNSLFVTNPNLLTLSSTFYDGTSIKMAIYRPYTPARDRLDGVRLGKAKRGLTKGFRILKTFFFL